MTHSNNYFILRQDLHFSRILWRFVEFFYKPPYINIRKCILGYGFVDDVVGCGSLWLNVATRTLIYTNPHYKTPRQVMHRGRKVIRCAFFWRLIQWLLCLKGW